MGCRSRETGPEDFLIDSGGGRRGGQSRPGDVAFGGVGRRRGENELAEGFLVLQRLGNRAFDLKKS